MRKIWTSVRSHILQDYTAGYYLAICFLMAAGLIVNYQINLEKGVIESHAGKPLRFVWYFLLYGFAYYTSCGIMAFFKNRREIFRQRSFWAMSIFGLLILSLNSAFPYTTDLLRTLQLDVKVFYWALSVANNFIGLILVIPPIVLFSRLTGQVEYFGLRPKSFDVKPYLILLALVSPAIGLASFDASFVQYYPTYKTNEVAAALSWPSWLPAAVYEFFYGLDFLNVELIFRGFMVIGMSRILGKEAIIPMVTTYCFLHFGKPAGEAVSSIFGGYLLGIIALHTRSIWGGVTVHVGVAWLMELAAFLQKL